MELRALSNTDIHYRPATPDDADALAELINFAGEGLPLYLWEGMAEPGESVWDVGRRRAQRDSGAFSYRNAVVAERAGRVVAALVSYRIAAEPGVIDAETPGMFVPLIELENLALDSWYVNVLAVYPVHRGRGLGSRLLQIAGEKARDNGCRSESIIVSDANTGARRLYERSGYRYVAERPMVKDAWENPGSNWVLLVK